MFSSERHETLWPFPSLPEAVKDRYSIGDLALRPFGFDQRDLSVDFNYRPLPFLVTALLDCCTRSGRGESVDQDFFWSLTVGKRIECLLNLTCAGESPEIAFAFLCPNTACGQASELELSLAEISELQTQAYAAERVSVQVGGHELALRRPTGHDQLVWLRESFVEEAAATRAMLRSLLLESASTETALDQEGAIPDLLVQQAAAAMEEYDPLVNFSLTVRCSYCGDEVPCEVDLEALSIRRLRQAQLSLLASVHRLAAHYHWSEAQIFAVPYWRRAHYLGFIAKEKNR